MPLIDAYLATRLPLGHERALFTGAHGARLSTTIMATTRRYAAAAGVTDRKRVTPHTLRHVFATEVLVAGANLRQVQELLGHKHLDSTQPYIRVTRPPTPRRRQATALVRLDGRSRRRGGGVAAT